MSVIYGRQSKAVMYYVLYYSYDRNSIAIHDVLVMYAPCQENT